MVIIVELIKRPLMKAKILHLKVKNLQDHFYLGEMGQFLDKLEQENYEIIRR